MDEKARIEEIRQRLSGNDYFAHPSNDAFIKGDIKFLLDLLDQKEHALELSERKNRVLSQQSMELMQEIENVRQDFGDSR